MYDTNTYPGTTPSLVCPKTYHSGYVCPKTYHSMKLFFVKLFAHTPSFCAHRSRVTKVHDLGH